MIDPKWGEGGSVNISDPNLGFNQTSRVVTCLSTDVDTNWFQAFVYVPPNVIVTTFQVAFAVDDGARVTIFNSLYPTGSPPVLNTPTTQGSYLFLDGTQGETEEASALLLLLLFLLLLSFFDSPSSATANLASFFVTGESNRIVVTQIDDCYVQNNLAAAFVLINGVQIDDLVRAPLVALEFLPRSIFLNGVSTMRINITNLNAFTLPNVRVNDTFDQVPSGVLLTSGSILGDPGCPELLVQAPDRVVLPAFNFTAGQFCSYSVPVQGILGRITSNYVVALADFSNPGISNVAALSIRDAPGVNLSFMPSTISLASNATTMTMIVRNDNMIEISGVTINYTVPAGLQLLGYPVGGPGCPVFQFPPTPPIVGPQVIFATGTLAAGQLCSYAFDAVGTGSSSSSFSVLSSNAPFAYSNVANLTFSGSPGLTKAYSGPSVAVGSIIDMIITITNPTAPTPQLMRFTDVLPAGLQVAGSGNVSPVSCPALTTTTNSVALPAGSTVDATCTYTIPLLGTVAGRTLNSLTVQLGAGPQFLESSVSEVELIVMGSAQSSKSYSTSSVALGGTVVLTVSIYNPYTLPMTGVSFVDDLSARGMAVTVPAPPSVLSGVGGCSNVLVTMGSIVLSGGVVPALGTCVYTVQVQANLASGPLPTLNSVRVTSSNSPTGPNATATVYVMQVIYFL